MLGKPYPGYKWYNSRYTEVSTLKAEEDVHVILHDLFSQHYL